jgi:hypothetical protein
LRTSSTKNGDAGRLVGLAARHHQLRLRRVRLSCVIALVRHALQHDVAALVARLMSTNGLWRSGLKMPAISAALRATAACSTC